MDWNDRTGYTLRKEYIRTEYIHFCLVPCFPLLDSCYCCHCAEFERVP